MLLFRKTLLTKILIIICMSMPGIIYAQTKEDIIGNWKVVKTELDKSANKEEKQKLEQIYAIFSKTTFQFNPDGSFILKSSEKNLNQQGIWEFNVQKRNIIVWDKESKGVRGKLMEILVEKRDDGFAFVMKETPIILIVSKAIITKSK